MEMIDFLPYERLRSVPEPLRDAATVALSRGHDGIKHPYSIPFTLNMQIDGQVVWWATLNFDQLYVETGYDGPQLFARYCSTLLRIVEGKESYDDKPVRRSVWQAVWETCYCQTDKRALQPLEDMRSQRADFTRKTWTEMAAFDPREFHAYSMNTVSAANSRGSTDRTEFRVVSRPDASHRWLFWTHVPWRLSGHPAEMAYWFERHVAQLRGPRRPIWSGAQKQRWTDAVHRELTGKTRRELEFDALAARPEEKPDVVLVLGSEQAVGGVRSWLAPRRAFGSVACIGSTMEFSFVESEDRHERRVRLLFRSVQAARTVLAEILSGERRRLGIGEHLRGILAADRSEDFSVLVGLSKDEEAPHRSAFFQRHGSRSTEYRNGLLLQFLA